MTKKKKKTTKSGKPSRQAGGAPTKLTAARMKKAEGYLAYCERHPIKKPQVVKGQLAMIEIPCPPTIEGLALHLEVTPKTIRNWCDAGTDFTKAETKLLSEFLPVVNKVRLKYSQYLVHYGLANVVNARMAVFLLSADLDKREKKELKLDGEIRTGDLSEMTDDELRAIEGHGAG